MYVAIGIIAIVLVAAIVYATEIGTRSAVDFSKIVDASHEIRFEVTIAHLWSEELLAHDPTVSEDDVWTHFDLAEKYVQGMLHGEGAKKSMELLVESEEIKTLLIHIRESMKTCRDITAMRLRERDIAVAGSEIDQKYDAAFSVLLSDLVRLETAVDDFIQDEIRSFTYTQTFLITAVILLSALVGTIIRVFDRKRSEDMTLIEKMNLDLQSANQQLFATEQQLRASNQQLRAGEQQLRASNQQLTASEQQLKATNQQLRASEEALRRSEEHYRTIFATAPNLIISLDAHGKVVECNGRSREILGFRPEDMIGRQFASLVHLDSGEPAEDFVKQIIGSAHTVNREFCVLKNNGQVVEVRMHAASLKDESDRSGLTVCIIEDITEFNRFRTEMQNVQKLESLGVLAGGIAHDFNNLLTAILGNVSLARLSAASDSKANDRLLRAEKASERAKDLAQQLLTFSKGGAPVKRTASLRDIISDSASFVFHGTNTACNIDASESLWPVHVDIGQLNQVFHNLFINADQAMPKGGTVNVVCENITLQSPLEVPPLPEGQYVKVSIRDDGTGIPVEYVEQIFDPYFSTKQQGSGLGLAISYSIIKKHRGHITVESESGRGSVFHIYLPAVQDQTFPFHTDERLAMSGAGNILIMDDEESVRETTGEMLRLLGYEVSFSRNGEEALDMYQTSLGSGSPFDVVLMDLTVPGGMGGSEVIKQLLRIDPKAKAIVMSGYSNNPVMSKFRQYGFKGVLLKPFKVEELAALLRNIMNRPEGES